MPSSPNVVMPGLINQPIGTPAPNTSPAVSPNVIQSSPAMSPAYAGMPSSGLGMPPVPANPSPGQPTSPAMGSPASPTSGIIQASQIDLNAPQMTEAGQMGKYLDPNSATNQMLKTRALQSANGVGTLNSSMTDAAISNGIIANAQSMGASDQNAYATAAGQNASMGTNVGITQMNNQNQINLTNLQNQNKTLLQSSSVGLGTYQSMMTQISAIQQNAALDPATRAQQIQTLINFTSKALQDQKNITGLSIGSNYNNMTANTGTTGAAVIGGSNPATPATPISAPATAAPATQASPTNNWVYPGKRGWR